MEITLEKIELVKDRTGVSYREAKEALEAADGSVVDAIIAIEDSVNYKSFGNASRFVSSFIDKIKEIVRKGNITKISVKKDGNTIVNLPINVGIVGVVLAPWGMLAGAIASLGFKCQVDLTTAKGDVISLSEKAGNIVETVVEKGSAIYDEVKEKAPEIISNVAHNAPEVFNNIKDKAIDKYYDIKYKNVEWEDVDSDTDACDKAETSAESECESKESEVKEEN